MALEQSRLQGGRGGGSGGGLSWLCRPPIPDGRARPRHSAARAGGSRVAGPGRSSWICWLRRRCRRRGRASDGADQPPRIRVLRAFEDFIAGPDLDDLAQIHHRDPVADPFDHRDVMADEQVGNARPVLDVEKRTTTCALTETSSAETDLSAMISLGSSISARAMQTRWRWPPENRAGSGRASRVELHLLHQLRGFCPTLGPCPARACGTARPGAAPTVICGFMLVGGSWWDHLDIAALAAQGLGASVNRSSWPSRTLPCERSFSRMMDFPVVDLP